MEHIYILPPEGLDYRDIEKSFVKQALDYTDWNQFKACKLLKMSRDQLRYRMKKYGLYRDMIQKKLDNENIELANA